MSDSFFTSLLVSSFGRTPAHRGPRAGVAVNLNVQFNDKYVTAGITVLGDAFVVGEGGLRRILHDYDLLCTDDSEQAVIGSPRILARLQSSLYRCPFF